MTDPSTTTLAGLRQRIRAAAKPVTARPDSLPETDDPVALAIAEVDGMLIVANDLVSQLARPANSWDDLDELMSKLLVRELTSVTTRLRRTVAVLHERLMRIDRDTRPIPRRAASLVEDIDAARLEIDAVAAKARANRHPKR
jgi:hypothetical protein